MVVVNRVLFHGPKYQRDLGECSMHKPWSSVHAFQWPHLQHEWSAPSNLALNFDPRFVELAQFHRQPEEAREILEKNGPRGRLVGDDPVEWIAGTHSMDLVGHP
jgi:hypothetical protein